MDWWWFVQIGCDVTNYTQTAYVCMRVLLACRAAARHVHRAASLARTGLAQVSN
jgi:hypothetical protein